MTVGSFEVPSEVVEDRKVPGLMNLLHDSIADDQACDSFVARSVSSLGLSNSDNVKKALRNLFETMAYLDTHGKNRVWAKLIRNRYASLFYRHTFDFIVGNPPHVNFESLTPEWRNAAKAAYTKYGMFNLKGLDARHGDEGYHRATSPTPSLITSLRTAARSP